MKASTAFDGPGKEKVVVRLSKATYARLLATPRPRRADLGSFLASGLELLADAPNAAEAALLETARDAAAPPTSREETEVDDDAWLSLDPAAVDETCAAASNASAGPADVVDGVDRYLFDDDDDDDDASDGGDDDDDADKPVVVDEGEPTTPRPQTLLETVSPRQRFSPKDVV